MANVQGAFGAVVVGSVTGGPVAFAETNNPPWRIASNNGTAIGYGDLVRLVSGGSPTGYITRWANGDGSAVNAGVGIFLGCRYFSTARQMMWWSRYWPGSDATGDVAAFLCSDPMAQFMIQATSGPLDQSTIGQTSDVTMGTVNTTTGISGMSLDAPSASNPSNLPFKILSVVTSPPGANGTDVTTTFNNVIVGFNNMFLKNLLTVHS